MPDPEPLFLPEGDDWGAGGPPAGPGAADPEVAGSGAPEEAPAVDEPRTDVAGPEAPCAGDRNPSF